MFLEPIPARLRFLDEPILLLGYAGEGRVLYARADGILEETPLDLIVTDWRYDPESRTWHDVQVEVDEPVDEEAE